MPFLFTSPGTWHLCARSFDVARNGEAPVNVALLVDQTPKLGRQDAGQQGVDWLVPTMKAKDDNFHCVACHVQGDTLFGTSLSVSTGYIVDTSTTTGIGYTANFLTDPQYQRVLDWLWPHPPSPAGGGSYITINSSHALFGLSQYDRYVSTSKSESLVKGVQAMLARQEADGRWAIDHTEWPVNEGDIEPTTHMIFALKQATQRVDAATSAVFQAALDKAVAWLKGVALPQNPTHTQDKALKLVGLVEAGVPKDDPVITSLRDSILADQFPDGGWAERSNASWSSAFGTGQALYALCRAGVSRFDPQVVRGIDWLIHMQMGYSPDWLYPYYTVDGPWLLRNQSSRYSPFVTTMWPVIALGCFGEVGLELSASPTQQVLLPGQADPQSATFIIEMTNSGAEVDTYDLTTAGGFAGWTATLNPSQVTLAVGETATSTLTISAPAQLLPNLSVLYTVIGTSQKNPEVTRSVSVSVLTSPPVVVGNPTETTIVDGDGTSTPINRPVRLAATVRDTASGTDVVGPGSGAVNFVVAGIAVGTDDDPDGDGVFEILWTPGLDWTKLGTQDLRAVYSGVDRPDPDPDLLSSFASGLITLIEPANTAPVAVDDSYVTDEDVALSVAVPGVLGNDSDVDGDVLTAVLVSDVGHGVLTLNGDGSFSYVPDADYHGSDSFTYAAWDGTATSSPATVSITVNPVNDAPVANAGPDQTVDEGANVTLSGSGSDVDGDPLTFSWTQTAGPAVTLGAATSTIPFFTAPQVDADTVLTFELTVSDGTASASDTVNVTVRNITAVGGRMTGGGGLSLEDDEDDEHADGVHDDKDDSKDNDEQKGQRRAER